MSADIGKTAAKLKEITGRSGLEYMVDEPYKVFKELCETGAADRKTAGAVLYFLVNGMLDGLNEESECDDLSVEIQNKCCFNKEMADTLSSIFISLYSKENMDEWKDMNLQGFSQFKNEEFSLNWKGFAVWDYGMGTVSCHYEADITVRPTENVMVDSELSEALIKNPFMTKEALQEYYTKLLRDHLDSEFEDYCTCDDYYQPVVEDFMADRCAVSGWCRKNGFELIACEDSGYDDGYEPKLWEGLW